MEKQYVGHGKAIPTKYGEIIKMSMTEEHIKMLQENLSNGWVNFDILKRKNPSEKGMTHYGVIDDWKPEGGNQPATKPAATANDVDEMDAEDLPF